MSSPGQWDARYAEPGYAYGSAPNDFVASVAHEIPPGPVLCLAEGQGRNAVHIASLGHCVTAVDRSVAGLRRARELARERGVVIETVAADMADLAIERGAWAGIVSVFAHVPAPLRARVHRAAAAGLRPGGVFVLEAYAPRQLELGTGGPKVRELLVPLDALRHELAGLELLIARETERDVIEGRYHTGRGAVVQVLARKPIS
jgi:SAM-dependent methyltransferase